MHVDRLCSELVVNQMSCFFLQFSADAGFDDYTFEYVFVCQKFAMEVGIGTCRREDLS
eukprot:c33954_g1_i1 orf=185-358(+)